MILITKDQTLAGESGSSDIFVRFEVSTEVTMKNAVFWDVTLCGSCKNVTRATRRNIPEDCILLSSLFPINILLFAARTVTKLFSKIKNLNFHSFFTTQVAFLPHR
jgi:hypothetical protein